MRVPARHSRNNINTRPAFSTVVAFRDVYFLHRRARGTVVCTSYRFYGRRQSGTDTSRSPLGKAFLRTTSP